jgi:hypothetical protein
MIAPRIDEFFYLDFLCGILYCIAAVVALSFGVLIPGLSKGRQASSKRVHKIGATTAICLSFLVRAFIFMPYGSLWVPDRYLIAMLHESSLLFYSALTPLFIFWLRVILISRINPSETVPLVAKERVYARSRLYFYILAGVLATAAVAIAVMGFAPILSVDLFVLVSSAIGVVILSLYFVLATCIHRVFRRAMGDSYHELLDHLSLRSLFVAFMMFCKWFSLILYFVLISFASCSACVTSPILYSFFLIVHFLVPELLCAYFLLRTAGKPLQTTGSSFTAITKQQFGEIDGLRGSVTSTHEDYGMFHRSLLP